MPTIDDIDEINQTTKNLLIKSFGTFQLYRDNMDIDERILNKNDLYDNMKEALENDADEQRANENTNPRANAIAINIVDLNVVPINVHSLMREIPLTNLYNYAITFDTFVTNFKDLNDAQKDLMKDPYMPIDFNVSREAGRITNDDFNNLFGDISSENGLKFINTEIYKKTLKAEDENIPDHAARGQERLNSKIVRNLVFLTLVQHAIKKKVKAELDFINSRVVTNTAAVSDLITTGTHDENIFEF